MSSTTMVNATNSRRGIAATGTRTCPARNAPKFQLELPPRTLQPVHVTVSGSTTPNKSPLDGKSYSSSTSIVSQAAMAKGSGNLAQRRGGFDASEIVPGLFLGSWLDADSGEVLLAKGIRRVLNVAVECPVSDSCSQRVLHGDLKVKKINIRDHSDEDISAHFEDAIKFIREGIEKNEGVLVHCRHGVSRSATIVLAYIMMYGVRDAGIRPNDDCFKAHPEMKSVDVAFIWKTAHGSQHAPSEGSWPSRGQSHPSSYQNSPLIPDGKPAAAIPPSLSPSQHQFVAPFNSGSFTSQQACFSSHQQSPSQQLPSPNRQQSNDTTRPISLPNTLTTLSFQQTESPPMPVQAQSATLFADDFFQTPGVKERTATFTMENLTVTSPGGIKATPAIERFDDVDVEPEFAPKKFNSPYQISPAMPVSSASSSGAVVGQNSSTNTLSSDEGKDNEGRRKASAPRFAPLASPGAGGKFSSHVSRGNSSPIAEGDKPQIAGSKLPDDHTSSGALHSSSSSSATESKSAPSMTVQFANQPQTRFSHHAIASHSSGNFPQPPSPLFSQGFNVVSTTSSSQQSTPTLHPHQTISPTQHQQYNTVSPISPLPPRYGHGDGTFPTTLTPLGGQVPVSAAASMSSLLPHRHEHQSLQQHSSRRNSPFSSSSSNGTGQGKMCYSEAFDYVKTRRPHISPNLGFVLALHEMDRKRGMDCPSNSDA